MVPRKNIRNSYVFLVSYVFYFVFFSVEGIYSIRLGNGLVLKEQEASVRTRVQISGTHIKCMPACQSFQC